MSFLFDMQIYADYIKNFQWYVKNIGAVGFARINYLSMQIFVKLAQWLHFILNKALSNPIWGPWEIGIYMGSLTEFLSQNLPHFMVFTLL